MQQQQQQLRRGDGGGSSSELDSEAPRDGEPPRVAGCSVFGARSRAREGARGAPWRLESRRLANKNPQKNPASRSSADPSQPSKRPINLDHNRSSDHRALIGLRPHSVYLSIGRSVRSSVRPSVRLSVGSSFLPSFRQSVRQLL